MNTPHAIHDRPVGTRFRVTPLLHLALAVLLLPGMFGAAAQADVTIVPYAGYIASKPAAAANTQTGDFLVAYLSHRTCGGAEGDVLRATLRDASGNAKRTDIQPLGDCTHRAVGRPAVAYSPQSDRFCIAVPVEDRSGGNFRVMVAYLNGDGTDTGIEDLALFSADAFHPGAGHGALRLVYNSLFNTCVLTAQVEDDNMNQIWAQMVSLDGSAVSFRKTLAGPTTSVIPSHGIAYAPIVVYPVRLGRYLFVKGTTIYLLDDNLDPIPATYTYPNHDPNDPPNSINIYIRTGVPEGGSKHFDVAFGTVEGKPRFLVVYSDENNCEPPLSTCPFTGDQQSGVWGTYIDPWKTDYEHILPDDEQNTPFPITNIYLHYDSSVDSSRWKPAVAYDFEAEGFFVVWRETPGDHPLNDEVLPHIRGAFVDRFVADDMYDQTLEPHWPPENFVLSEGLFCSSGICQVPDFPDVVPVGTGGRAMAIWEEFPLLWQIRGNQFPLAPENDDRMNAELIQEGEYQGTLVRATNDGMASCGYSDDAPDVWYLYQVYGNGTLKVSTCGSNDYDGIDTGVNTVLSLHNPDDGSQLDGHCNDDWFIGSYTGACYGDAGRVDTGERQDDSAISTEVSSGDSILIRVAHSYYTSSTRRGPFYLQVEFDGDGDGDGFQPPEDCDDTDPDIHPGADELCNGVDDDCDGSTDEDFTDLGDPCSAGIGYCAQPGEMICHPNQVSTMCSAVPGTPLLYEMCNGVDDDCDGSTDEDFTNLGSPCSAGIGACTQTGEVICTSDQTGTECSAVPGTGSSETCNGVDDDCDGTVDEGVTITFYRDSDGDTYGDAGGGTVQACSPPAGYADNDTDCNDGDDTVHPGATELCDGKDNNCNGVGDVEEGVCNTPPSDEPVTVEETVAGDTGEVTVTVVFPSVDMGGGGETFITVGDCQPLEGFILIPASAPVCVGINTTAEHSTPVMVCMTYDESDLPFPEEEMLNSFSIYKYDPDAEPPSNKYPLPLCDPYPEGYQSVDTDQNRVCRCTDDFSTFALGLAADSDGDGIPDMSDGCPEAWDPSNACDGCLSAIDLDQDVDGMDLAEVCQAFGSSTGDPNYNPAADFNGDGAVDAADLAVTALGFGRTDCGENP